MVGFVGEVFLVGEMSKFGEDGERLREDRASFLLGLANGLQYISCKSCVIFCLLWDLPFSGKVVQGGEALDGPRESRGDGRIVGYWGEGSK